MHSWVSSRENHPSIVAVDGEKGVSDGRKGEEVGDDGDEKMKDGDEEIVTGDDGSMLQMQMIHVHYLTILIVESCVSEKDEMRVQMMRMIEVDVPS